MNKTQSPSDRQKLKNALIILIIALLASIFVVAGFIVYTILSDYNSAQKTYDAISNAYTAPVATPTTALPADDGAASEQPPSEPVVEKDYSPITVDFDSLLKANSQIVGWLYSPDTLINYPVLRAEDNEKYLHTLFDGSYNPSGSIFLDCSCSGDFSRYNTIVYGHNMNDGSMFHSLLNYKSADYYNAHPVIYLNTPTQNYKLLIFSAYITDPDAFSYEISFAGTAEYESFLNQLLALSKISTGVVPSGTDRIITFSTCDYDYEDARFLVHAVLVPID